MSISDDDWEAVGADVDQAAGGRWTPPPASSLRPGRRRLLVGLASVPWLAVGVGLLGRRATQAAPVSTDAASPPAHPTGTVSPTSDVEATPAPTPPSGTDERSEHSPQSDHRLTAAAVLEVHERAGPDRYVDHAVVERVVHPRADAAVVVVVASVLAAVDGTWQEPSQRRLAVPMAFDGPHPVAAGPPWPLSRPPVTSARSLDPVPLDDPALAAELRGVLEARGWDDVEVTSVASDGRWPLVARVDAVAPDESTSRDREVWFTRHGTSWLLAGEDSDPGHTDPNHTDPGDTDSDDPAPTTADSPEGRP